ncbi:MAG TPA: hypothetical protein VIG64_10080 [Actinomycetota bacterium]|jgi:hypothetical protein
MRTIRWLAALVLIASLTATAPPVATAAELPSLKALNLISGDEPGSMRVRLPQRIRTESLYGWDASEFTGGGRMIYMLLMKERKDGTLNQSIFIESARMGRCSYPGCPPPPEVEGRSGGSSSGPFLPAGVYRLYFVPDGADATVLLRLGGGLKGRTHLSPTEAVRVEIETLAPQLLDVVSPPAFVAYEEAPFAGKGVTFFGEWFKSPVVGTLAYGHCIFWNERPDSPSAYLPSNCDDRTVVVTAEDAPNGYDSGLTSFGPLARAVGAWYISAAVLENSGSVVMWLQTSPD